MPGLTKRSGYGGVHQALRKRWAAVVERGEASCARCGRWIAPGSRWHLDHTDDRTAYLGPSHAYCNTTAPNRRRARRSDPEPMLDEPTPAARQW